MPGFYDQFVDALLSGSNPAGPTFADPCGFVPPPDAAEPPDRPASGLRRLTDWWLQGRFDGRVPTG